MRRYGEAVRRGQSYRRRRGAYGVLLREGQVLLTHQTQPVPEFQLPGGGIDPGESPVVALHREVMEETGWRIGGLRRLGTYRRFTHMPEYDLWAEKLCEIYVARPTRRHGSPTEPGHHAVWVPASVACELVASPGDKAFLQSFIP